MTYGVRDVPTWEMTRNELARTWAEHYGVYVDTNTLYKDSVALSQGWAPLEEILEEAGAIKVGTGIVWSKSPSLSTIRFRWLAKRSEKRRRKERVREELRYR